MKHIMLDCETLGTTADAVIMSVGAVKFDLNSKKIDDAGFYASIDIESNLSLGRRVQEDTLLWWLKQEAAAQQVFHEAKITLSEALTDLSDWIGDDGYTVWSNGADFDLPMLAHAYSQIGVAAPWKFWNSRCYRTYKNLPGAKDIRLPPSGVKHNALSDAYQQAQTIQAIHAALFGAGATKPTKVKA
jgi:hypothetical protein